MKKQLALYTLSAALVFGFVSPAAAQHCDVRKGDSMWIIAKRYHVNFHDVLRLNKHFKNQHLIHPKDEVELPDGNTGTGTTSNSGSDNISESDNEVDRSEKTEYAQEVLRLVNAERSKQGLKGLQLSDKLDDIAVLKAKDMANKGYFDHTSPTYGSPFEMLQSFGVQYRSAGENIAAGQKTPQEVMTAWMNSSGHRANILNKSYTKLGIGESNGGSYGTYWCQLFIED
ncbi:MAG: CAP domain-containing protein [Bacteroidaceae bacterium]|nr:CAP domain-containing protein [Bacteroidaceae bacterium]